jgi:hypothetical protein
VQTRKTGFVALTASDDGTPRHRNSLRAGTLNTKDGNSAFIDPIEQSARSSGAERGRNSGGLSPRFTTRIFNQALLSESRIARARASNGSAS